MSTIIFSNRDNDSREWITASEGRKFITLKFQSCYTGRHDVTIVYDIADKQTLIETLNNPMCNIDALTEFGWGPKPIKTTVHEANR